MKARSTLLFLCSIVALGGVSVASAPKSNSVHYELKLKSGSFGDMGVRKMWIKGNNMRWEGKAERLPLLLIKNKQGTFLVHPWQKYAAKYPENSNRSNPKVLFPGPVGPVKDFLKSQKAVKHGTEKVNKQLCSVYAYTDSFTKRPSKIWVDEKTNKPVKLSWNGERGKVDSVTATYTRFDINGKVNDSLFQLPKGYAVKSMPTRRLTSKSTSKKLTSNKPG